MLGRLVSHCLLVGAAAFVGCSAGGGDENGGWQTQAVSNGTPVANAAQTGIVAILRDGATRGSGILLAPGWVLTSTTAVYEKSALSGVRVRLGNATDEDRQERGIAAFYLHPLRAGAPDAQEMNFALLRLSTPFPEGTKTLSLPTQFPAGFTGQHVTCMEYSRDGVLESTGPDPIVETLTLQGLVAVIRDRVALPNLPQQTGGPCFDSRGRLVSVITGSLRAGFSWPTRASVLRGRVTS